MALPSKGALFRRASLSRRRCVSARLKRTPYAYCLAARKSNEAGGSSELHSSSIHTGIFISPCGREWGRGGVTPMSLKDRRQKQQNKGKRSHDCYLGQYMKNLGIHQSSSVSVLSDAENLSADLAENTQGWTLTNCTRACLISLFVCFKPRIEPYLRQRGCGYVHVAPCCHRQQ